MRWQAHDVHLEIYTDSDWAGDHITRKSFTGGAIFNGSHLIKTISKQQAVVALSSAEAELYAACKVTTEGLGVQSYLRDLGRRRTAKVHTDSSAALALTDKRGLGKAKHIDVQHLWLQDAVRDGRVTCYKVAGHLNPADLMTKGLDGERISFLMGLCGFTYG